MGFLGIKTDLILLESKEEYKLIHIERQKQFLKWSFGMHYLQNRLTALESFRFYKQLSVPDIPCLPVISSLSFLLLDGNRIWILYQIFLINWLPDCCLWFLSLEDSSFIFVLNYEIFSMYMNHKIDNTTNKMLQMQVKSPCLLLTPPELTTMLNLVCVIPTSSFLLLLHIYISLNNI